MKNSSHRFPRSVAKGFTQRAEDVAWAISLTCLVLGFLAGIGVAGLVGWGSRP